ncbi:MAG: LemA family protein [bacterium]
MAAFGASFRASRPVLLYNYDDKEGEESMLPFLLILLVLVHGVVFWAIGTYNKLVGLKVRGDNAWSDVDVQLKRRYDLIPNLVETVKGYAAHEKSTFEEVTKWRNAAMNAQSPGDKAQAENMLTGALKTLFAVAENYPQLRATENFQSLQKDLAGIEDAVQNARRYYNAVVRDYNTKILMFPSSIVANFGNFKQREFFELSSAAEREAPKVQFT